MRIHAVLFVTQISDQTNKAQKVSRRSQARRLMFIKLSISELALPELDDVVAPARIYAFSRIQGRHRFVADIYRFTATESIERGLHRRAVGAEHADLDIIAVLDVGGQQE